MQQYREIAMNAGKLILLLLLIGAGCRDHSNSSAEPRDMLSRDQIIQIAQGRAREMGSFADGEMKVHFDDGNKVWLGILGELEREDAEAAEAYRRLLDKKNYQALRISHDPPSIDGTYWVFVDKMTGEVIATAVGL